VTVSFTIEKLWKTDVIEENNLEIEFENNSFTPRIGHNSSKLTN
jgi:hypothetical protein